MKVSGYMIREALKGHDLKRTLAATQFESTLYAFEGEKKAAPMDVYTAFSVAERAIAKLQYAQTMVNVKVQVDVLGERMSLCEAIKRVGGASRAEKMWRKAAGEKDKKPRFYGDDTDATVRKANETRATATVSAESAVAQAQLVAKYTSALRVAIAGANAQEVEIEGLDPALFE